MVFAKGYTSGTGDYALWLRLALPGVQYIVLDNGKQIDCFNFSG